ncbi:MAG: hypothetical protein EZS28_031234 [Streblomastix strix]|uniref:Uncharacterized protein n=1 Tax=Streblomastix strix TaxID=222440 RepID=A0A5J4US58_9EUKA|nr:MAG: hypothetical protein EZS28_031234 [Streblomastix strix]
MMTIFNNPLHKLKDAIDIKHLIPCESQLSRINRINGAADEDDAKVIKQSKQGHEPRNITSSGIPSIPPSVSWVRMRQESPLSFLPGTRTKMWEPILKLKEIPDQIQSLQNIGGKQYQQQQQIQQQNSAQNGNLNKQEQQNTSIDGNISMNATGQFGTVSSPSKQNKASNTLNARFAFESPTRIEEYRKASGIRPQPPLYSDHLDKRLGSDLEMCGGNFDEQNVDIDFDRKDSDILWNDDGFPQLNWDGRGGGGMILKTQGMLSNDESEDHYGLKNMPRPIIVQPVQLIDGLNVQVKNSVQTQNTIGHLPSNGATQFLKNLVNREAAKDELSGRGAPDLRPALQLSFPFVDYSGRQVSEWREGTDIIDYPAYIRGEVGVAMKGAAINRGDGKKGKQMMADAQRELYKEGKNVKDKVRENNKKREQEIWDRKKVEEQVVARRIPIRQIAKKDGRHEGLPLRSFPDNERTGDMMLDDVGKYYYGKNTDTTRMIEGGFYREGFRRMT